MNFQPFAEQIFRNVTEMLRHPAQCFFVSVERDEVFTKYLSTFKPQDNPQYAERTEHDCSTCKQFIRNLGHMVSIQDDLSVKTIWDGVTGDYGYVANTVARCVRAQAVTSPALFEQAKQGCKENAGTSKRSGNPEIFRHLYAEVPVTADLATKNGDLTTSAEMLKRALESLSEEAVTSVLELIAQGSLYRGDQWKTQLEQLLELLRAFPTSEPSCNRYIWLMSRKHANVARIRNTSIGTLLVDLSDGKDLEEAVAAYERVTAPENYRRPTELVTQASLARAKAAVEKLGLLESLPHRFARIDDISVKNVLFVDRTAKKRMRGGVDPFESLGATATVEPKSFDRVQEISKEAFLRDVLPVSTKLEVLVSPAHRSRFISLLAPTNPEAPALTRWSNNFTWAYAGNLADGSMKKLVEKHGGAVDGDLRFSISWNEDGQNQNDMDAHASYPLGGHIWFAQKQGHTGGGALDVDIRYPEGDHAVENITWPDRRRMPDGTYKLWVETYADRGGRGPMKAEVEFDGVIHAFEYPGTRAYEPVIQIATVTLKQGVFSIQPGPYAVGSAGTKGSVTWGVQENAFTRVLSVMRSPNYWDGEAPTGQEHVLFMLEGCVNPDTPNAFFNEFLKPELNPHRKVLEALGRSLKVAPDTAQLSGVGFVSTLDADMVVRPHGATVRTLRVK